MSIRDISLKQDHRIRIVVVMQRTLVRQALVSLLDSTEQMHVVAHSDTTKDGIRLAQEFRPDVVIVSLDGSSGSAGIGLSELKQAVPNARVLALTDEVHHGQVEIAIRSGVEGFTLTSITYLELEHAIGELARGRPVLHPEVASALALFSMARHSSDGNAHALTPRQCEVLSLMADGLPNKQIARRLGIGPQTVKTHVSRILDTLGSGSRTEAVALAMREGLVA